MRVRSAPGFITLLWAWLMSKAGLLAEDGMGGS